MKWVPTTIELLRGVALRPDQAEKDVRELLTDEFGPLLERSSRTLLGMDGAPIASIGVIDAKGGSVGEDEVGMVWAVISEEATHNPVALARGTRRWMEWAAKEWGYLSIAASIDTRKGYLLRWAEFMGFEPIDEMSGGPEGHDSILYLRRFGDVG